ncbi:MAG: Ig-like domain-containing protein [Mediterranea sp.]|nr:Ig-like domain-containing protein [Mediterranea sp.]
MALIACSDDKNKKEEHTDVAVKEVNLDHTTVTLNKGQTTQLTATVLPEEATDKTLTWTSGDDKIASVDDRGTVTGVNAGTTTIRATAVNKIFGVCTVKVLSDEVVAPDEHFKAFLLKNYDLDKDGKVSLEEAAQVDNKMTIDIPEVKDLTGLEYFGNLMNLECTLPQEITALDLSSNTSLNILTLNDAPGISALDLSANVNLTDVTIYGSRLKTLDLTHCIYITLLSFGNNANLTEVWMPDVNTVYRLRSYVNEDGAELKLKDNTPNDELVPIPDILFRNRLRINFDKDNDGLLTKEEAKLVTAVDCNNYVFPDYVKITSAEGIEYFENLESLDISWNKLSKLDVSKNPKLTTLTCRGNNADLVLVFKNVEQKKQMTSLDMDATTKIEYVEAIPDEEVVPIEDANFLAFLIRNFDTDGDEKLSKTEAKAVEEIFYPGAAKGVTPLTSLRGIEYFTGLKVLRCAANALTSLDLSNNLELTKLVCTNNKQLSSLDISKNTKLESLECGSTALTGTLDLSHCLNLKKLFCDDNALTEVRFKRQTLLSKIPKTDLKIDVSTNITFEEKAPEGSINIPDVRFLIGLLPIADTNGDGIITEEEAAKVEKIELFNGTITNVKGIEYFTGLIHFNITKNPLTSPIDLSKNTKLQTFYCVNCGQNSLDLSKNTELVDLDCSDNPLGELNLSKNTKLTTLWCSNTQLSSLDVSRNTKLVTLRAQGNQIANLSLTANTLLVNLFCNSNLLTGLNLTKNVKLENLYCASNKLTGLILTKNTSLRELDCKVNRITSLDLSNNLDLVQLDCSRQEQKTGNTLKLLNQAQRDKIKRFDASGFTIQYK